MKIETLSKAIKGVSGSPTSCEDDKRLCRFTMTTQGTYECLLFQENLEVDLKGNLQKCRACLDSGELW